VTAPEQYSPPVYACAAGTVLHGHAGSTLEPGVVLYTFLPPGAADALLSTEPRVDVHADGPGAMTVTVRALAGDTSLTWQLPLAPFVAALPGQSGDDGRMVLLAVVDAEPSETFWADPVDCERLAAELQLPVGELAEALRGRLTPWLDEDLRLLLDDDAYHRAGDRSPAQTLAEAVLGQYRGDLAAEQGITRLLRALTLAPHEHSAELGDRLCAAVVTAVTSAPERALDQVLAGTAPFETELLRLLTELPPRLRATPEPEQRAAAMDVLLAAPDRDEGVRAAVDAVTRIARTQHGPDLSDEELLQRLLMVDDALEVRLAALWLGLATAEPAPELTRRIEAEGPLGAQWLRQTAAALARLGPKAKQDVSNPAVDERTVRACTDLAAQLRRSRRGPGSWLTVAPSAACVATMSAYATGLDAETVTDLLDELVADDVTGVDLLDGLVCATAQVLVRLDPDVDATTRHSQVSEMLDALPTGSRGARWLLATCLREAHEHDAGAVDLSPYVPRDSATDPDRLAERAGRTGVLRAALQCLDALAATVGPEAEVSRDGVLGGVFPAALDEHELLRER
jgi:hypothetical protein